MSLPAALVDYYMRQVEWALLITLALLSLACCGGWWTGDRYDLPTIEVNW